MFTTLKCIKNKRDIHLIEDWSNGQIGNKVNKYSKMQTGEHMWYVYGCLLYNYFNIFLCLTFFHNKMLKKNHRYSFKSLIYPLNCWPQVLIVIEGNLFNLKIFLYQIASNFPHPTKHSLTK